MNVVPTLLVVVAAAAFVFAVFSALKAWSLSYGHPAFDALGWKKWIMGTLVIGYMPPVAIPFVKRYFMGFGVFILAIVGVAVYVVLTGGTMP
jgi:hypothetical protein